MDVTTRFQALLDDAVDKGLGPGFQCVVFNRDSIIFNGISGVATASTPLVPTSKPLKHETLFTIASCSKLAISLIVLHIIDRNLTNTGFSINDLDNHEALVKILPEFKHGSGSYLTKIFEGFEGTIGQDGKRVMKLRDTRNKMTLRMLLTHTAGLAYSWCNPIMKELGTPSDGSVPQFGDMFSSGAIKDFEVPLVAEPGTAWQYGMAADWLAQFAVRSTGKSLRELHKEIIFEPLGVPPSEADLWISPSLEESRAAIHFHNPEGGWIHIPLAMYTTEHKPPEGKAYNGSGAITASLQAYAKVLQAVVRQESKILSKAVWELAMKDDLKPRGLTVPKPAWKTTNPLFSYDIEEFAKSTIPNGTGVNLLQCHVALAPTVSGRPAGSFAWAGIANTYYFIDPINEVGAIFGTQVLPFFEPGLIEMRDKLEGLVYEVVARNTS